MTSLAFEPSLTFLKPNMASNCPYKPVVVSGISLFSLLRAGLKILKTDTRIGLCCDESFLLTPRKSVTAVAGITGEPAPEKPQGGCGHKCGGCAKKDCAFRREN